MRRKILRSKTESVIGKSLGKIAVIVTIMWMKTQVKKMPTSNDPLVPQE
jgi:hypothetical protein